MDRDDKGAAIPMANECQAETCECDALDCCGAASCQGHDEWCRCTCTVEQALGGHTLACYGGRGCDDDVAFPRDEER